MTTNQIFTLIIDLIYRMVFDFVISEQSSSGINKQIDIDNETDWIDNY